MNEIERVEIIFLFPFSYVLSGFQGAKDHLNSHGIRGLNWLVHGEVPAAAGLSSSSALVCASVFTTLIGMTGKVLDGYSKVIISLIDHYSSLCLQDDIANVAIKCERLVGLEGGGMDQVKKVVC